LEDRRFANSEVLLEGASIILFKVNPWNINKGVEYYLKKRKRHRRKR